MSAARVSSPDLILLTYLSTHLLNHALGLISLDAMERRSSLVSGLVAQSGGNGAAVYVFAHAFSLALWSLYQRRHLRIPLWEALQLTLGLSIPPLLSLHFVGTRMQHEWFGVDDSYSLLVLTLWHAQPWDGLKQATHHRRLAARLHRLPFLAAGCDRGIAPGGNAILFLGRALLYCCRSWGCSGFTQAGHEVDSLVARNPDWIAQVVQQSNRRRAANANLFIVSTTPLWRPSVLAVILTLLARIAR